MATRNNASVGCMLSMLKWICVMLVMVKLVCAGYNSGSERDALMALKKSLVDPNGVLDSWDLNLVDACTFFHVTCDADNHVIRLDLSDYNLSGNLVPDLQSLKYLKYMELYKNNIQGFIPPELGNLENLLSLDLYNNNISGSIPAELGKLKSLLFMRLMNNHLTGPIPTELTNIPSLRIVDLSTNDLSGTVPTMGSFQNLPLLNVSNNPRLQGGQMLGLAGYGPNF